MRRRLFFAALALTALAGCTDDSYVGDKSLLEENGGAISFNMKTPAITRAEDKTGSSAATDLNNQFVVFGYKTMSDDSKQTVFSNYQVNYVSTSAHTTTSNSAGWEYVGYKSLSANMTDYNGVTYNANHAAEAADADQTIKYWDFSASNYKFYAYSLGTGVTSGGNTTYANASLMSNADTYTLTGNQDQLAACYISELKNIEEPNSTTAKEVDLRFLSINSKIQLGFYETIPGYSVKSLKFYESSTDNTSDDTPVLYAGSSILPKTGTYTVTFDNGKPQLAWAAAQTDGTQSNVGFSALLSDKYVSREYQEVETTSGEKIYIGRASNEATTTDVKPVLPYATGADLTLKVDYVLVSRDKSGETIEAKGATAKIPAAFTQWKPNYKYTYLFKISENSNPLIGEVTGLYPITLDAVVADGENGSQETITTVSEPSITSYAKASAVTTDNEYKTGNNIYLVVEDGATNPELTVGTKAKLYYATVESGAAQGITEETVKNAIAQNTPGYNEGTILTAGTPLDGYSTYDGENYTACTDGTKADGTTKYYKSAAYVVTDALGKKLSVFAATGLTAINAIPIADSPTGVAISVNGAKFTPAVPTYTRIADDTVLPAGTYYTKDDGTTTETINSNHTVTSSDNYYYKTTSAGYYVFEYIKEGGNYYKVIKVVD